MHFLDLPDDVLSLILHFFIVSTTVVDDDTQHHLNNFSTQHIHRKQQRQQQQQQQQVFDPSIERSSFLHVLRTNTRLYFLYLRYFSPPLNGTITCVQCRAPIDTTSHAALTRLAHSRLRHVRVPPHASCSCRMVDTLNALAKQAPYVKSLSLPVPTSERAPPIIPLVSNAFSCLRSLTLHSSTKQTLASLQQATLRFRLVHLHLYNAPRLEGIQLDNWLSSMQNLRDFSYVSGVEHEIAEDETVHVAYTNNYNTTTKSKGMNNNHLFPRTNRAHQFVPLTALHIIRNTYPSSIHVYDTSVRPENHNHYHECIFCHTDRACARLALHTRFGYHDSHDDVDQTDPRKKEETAVKYRATFTYDPERIPSVPRRNQIGMFEEDVGRNGNNDSASIEDQMQPPRNDNEVNNIDNTENNNQNDNNDDDDDDGIDEHAYEILYDDVTGAGDDDSLRQLKLITAVRPSVSKHLSCFLSTDSHLLHLPSRMLITTASSTGAPRTVSPELNLPSVMSAHLVHAALPLRSRVPEAEWELTILDAVGTPSMCKCSDKSQHNRDHDDNIGSHENVIINRCEPHIPAVVHWPCAVLQMLEENSPLVHSLTLRSTVQAVSSSYSSSGTLSNRNKTNRTIPSSASLTSVLASLPCLKFLDIPAVLLPHACRTKAFVQSLPRLRVLHVTLSRVHMQSDAVFIERMPSLIEMIVADRNDEGGRVLQDLELIHVHRLGQKGNNSFGVTKQKVTQMKQELLPKLDICTKNGINVRSITQFVNEWTI